MPTENDDEIIIAPGSGDNSIGGAWAFIGDLSEARVYTKAMTDAELLATWQAMGGAG